MSKQVEAFKLTVPVAHIADLLTAWNARGSPIRRLGRPGRTVRTSLGYAD